MLRIFRHLTPNFERGYPHASHVGSAQMPHSTRRLPAQRLDRSSLFAAFFRAAPRTGAPSDRSPSEVRATRPGTIASLVLSCLMLSGCLETQPKPVIAAAASLRSVMPELLATFGTDMTVTYGGSGTLRQQVHGGAPVDLVVFASAQPARPPYTPPPPPSSEASSKPEI